MRGAMPGGQREGRSAKRPGARQDTTTGVATRVASSARAERTYLPCSHGTIEKEKTEEDACHMAEWHALACSVR